MTNPNQQKSTHEQDGTAGNNVRLGLGRTAKRLVEGLKSVFSIPDDAGVVRGYRPDAERPTTLPRTEADIRAHSSRVDQNGWAHDTTSGSGSQPTMTDDLLEAGDAAKAAGRDVTEAIKAKLDK